VLAVGDGVFLGFVKALDGVTQLWACPAAGLLGFENTGSEKFRDIVQLVGGKAQEKLPRRPLVLARHHGTEGPDEHGFRRR